MTVVAGGSGSPEAELITHELLEFTDADTFVRVGGSGGIHPRVSPGDVVVTTGVVRDEGMTRAYIPVFYPAVAHHEVVLAMSRAAVELGCAFHQGVTRSSDSDFCGVGRPGAEVYFQPWRLDILETRARAGVLNGDRESAAVVTLAELSGRLGGSVCSVADNAIANRPFVAGAGMWRPSTSRCAAWSSSPVSTPQQPPRAVPTECRRPSKPWPKSVDTSYQWSYGPEISTNNGANDDEVCGAPGGPCGAGCAAAKGAGT